MGVITPDYVNAFTGWGGMDGRGLPVMHVDLSDRISGAISGSEIRVDGG